MANYVQPDFRNPVVHPSVGNSPTPNADAVRTGSAPAPAYVEQLNDRDDPHRTIRGAARTKLGF
jgi:hypothetical protein